MINSTGTLTVNLISEGDDVKVSTKYDGVAGTVIFGVAHLIVNDKKFRDNVNKAIALFSTAEKRKDN